MWELKWQSCGDPAMISVKAWSKKREKGKRDWMRAYPSKGWYCFGNPKLQPLLPLRKSTRGWIQTQEGYHCRSDKICPDQLVLTLVLLEHSVSDLIIHNNTCLLGWAMIECLLESNRCSGGRDVRRYLVTWLLLTSMEGSHVIQTLSNGK